MRLANYSVTRSRPAPEFSGVNGLLTGVTIVASLYFAREILIPFALAVLISFVLAPLAVLLRRTGLPRSASVLIVVITSFGLILGIGAFGASQIAQLAEKLPEYQSNLRAKIRAIKGATTTSGSVSQATKVIEDLGQEISTPKSGPQAVTPAGGAPIPVEIRAPNNNPLKVASELLQPILGPLAGTGLVLIFVIFLMLQREDLRDRVIRLLGTKTLNRTTEAMDEAAIRLSRYFLLQTALNAVFGALVGIGLWLIGVPSPWLWGIFTMLLRFVPYIGSIIAAALPVALAAAVDPGWTMVAWTVALFAIGEPLMGHAVEPLVLGHQTGLSPVAIIISATFWTWLWGPIGLVLATPITLCLVILGQYTQRLEFVSVLLGDQPVLTPSESLYQRLIAGDPAEAIELAEQQLKATPLVEYYDQIVLPGLALAQHDAQNDALSAERQLMLVDGVQNLVEGLVDHLDETDTDQAVEPSKIHRENVEPSILSVGGRTQLDRAAATLLADTLNRTVAQTRVTDTPGLAGIAEIAAQLASIRLVCVSFVGSSKSAQVKFVVRRIRRLCPNAKVLVGLWCVSSTDPELAQIKENAGADFFATSLKEAVAIADKLARRETSSSRELLLAVAP